MADKPLWMPLYPAAYRQDTHHLSTLEHGAYFLLLMAAWDAGGKLPGDPARLARIALLDAEQWAEVGPVVLTYFQRRNDGFEHSRVTRELSKAGRLIEQKRMAGKASAKARAAKENSNGCSTDVSTKRQREANQLQLQSSSVSKDTGPASPADPQKKVFDDGLALLIDAGDDHKPARSFLGMLRKNHGDRKVADAILQAVRGNITDPRPWLVATLNKAANDHTALIASAQRTFGDKEIAA